MDFRPDGSFRIEDPAALKTPEPSSGGGTTAVLPGPGSRLNGESGTFDMSPFLDDKGLPYFDGDRWPGEPGFRVGSGRIEPPVVGGTGLGGSSWNWQQPGLITEPWMQTIAQDVHDWEKIGKSWDWLAECCGRCAEGRGSTRSEQTRTSGGGCTDEDGLALDAEGAESLASAAIWDGWSLALAPLQFKQGGEIEQSRERPPREQQATPNPEAGRIPEEREWPPGHIFPRPMSSWCGGEEKTLSSIFRYEHYVTFKPFGHTTRPLAEWGAEAAEAYRKLAKRVVKRDAKCRGTCPGVQQRCSPKVTIKTDILEVRIRGFLTEPYYFLGIPWFSIQTASVIVIMKIDITLKCICINELRTDFMIGTLPGL